MKKLCKIVIVLNVIVCGIAVILRMNFDYFAQINLVDFISFIGIFFWIVGGSTLLGGFNYKSSRLADRTPDSDYDDKQFHFAFVLFVCGLPSIAASIVLWIMQ